MEEGDEMMLEEVEEISVDDVDYAQVSGKLHSVSCLLHGSEFYFMQFCGLKVCVFFQWKSGLCRDS